MPAISDSLHAPHTTDTDQNLKNQTNEVAQRNKDAMLKSNLPFKKTRRHKAPNVTNSSNAKPYGACLSTTRVMITALKNLVRDTDRLSPSLGTAISIALTASPIFQRRPYFTHTRRCPEDGQQRLPDITQDNFSDKKTMAKAGRLKSKLYARKVSIGHHATTPHALITTSKPHKQLNTFKH
ncbi:hypothetical protein PSEUDO8O_120476 [Pseudomonas sp. 8O]|nr:hypothetical protein PSEUDO8O_120476 [Pseudomonas sp. 8O]